MLPAHTSHVTQPLVVSCFGPLKKIYNSGCRKYLKDNPGRVITRYDVCQLACKAFGKAITPCNAIAGFRKTGIYPLNRNIGEDITASSEPHISSNHVQHDSGPSSPAIERAAKKGKPSPPKTTEALLSTNYLLSSPHNYKKRKDSSIDTSGKAITEPSIVATLTKMPATSCTSSETVKRVSKKPTIAAHKSLSPQPGTSNRKIMSCQIPTLLAVMKMRVKQRRKTYGVFVKDSAHLGKQIL